MSFACARSFTIVSLVWSMSFAAAARAEVPQPALDTCALALAEEARVELIWYPSSEYFLVTHTEMIVGDETWDGYGSYKTKRTAEATERAARMGGRGFVRIGLRVTPAEQAAIRAYMDREGSSLGTCSGALCRAVVKNSGVKLPFGVRQIPTLMVLYAGLAKILGYGRIGKIEWVGPKGTKLLRWSSLGFVGPLWEMNIAHDLGLAGWHFVHGIPSLF